VKYPLWRILMNFEKWVKEYRYQLGKAVMLKPADYPWFPGISVDSVADKMTKAFAQGSYNKDGIAVKNTCKALGVSYTYKAINEYLKG